MPNIDWPKADASKTLMERLERRTVLSILSMLALIVVIFVLIFHTIPQESRDILNMLIGALIMLVKEAFGYDFGSTTSSVNKDDTIKQAAMAALPPIDNKGMKQ